MAHPKKKFRQKSAQLSPQRDHQRTNDTNNGFVFGGVRTVGEALTKGVAREILMTEAATKRPELRDLLSLAREHRLPQNIVASDLLDRLVGDSQHQGVACRIQQLPQIDWLTLLNGEPKGNLVALDQVQDPMNLGAVIRSANAFGVAAIICPKDGSAPLTQTAVKASAGAALHTPVIYVTNMARALEELKEHRYWVVALDGDARDSIDVIDPGKPWVLVAGSEGKGIRPLVLKGSDFQARIPMLGDVGSFNVSVACGIALYQLSRR